jgi:cytochrome c biogenesis protein CcmG/thiol:disulfide interchange protein DsbE
VRSAGRGGAPGARIVGPGTCCSGGLPSSSVSLFDDGERIRLADLEGKPTVVNFFASWCINCERELPDFARAASEFGDDVNFVFVHT